MFEIDSAQGNLALLIGVVLFVVKGFALVDCVARPAGQFTYRDTLPKTSWLVILVLALAANLVTGWNPLGFLNLIGIVAALVYLAQMRGSSA